MGKNESPCCGSAFSKEGRKEGIIQGPSSRTDRVEPAKLEDNANWPVKGFPLRRQVKLDTGNHQDL